MMATSKTSTARADAPVQEELLGGKYRLESVIGEGGMGSVWRARNVMLDLPVALKLVHPEMRGRDSTARLLTEARVEAKLRHPSVVRVFDYGETRDGEAYIVMELLEGSCLADLLDRGAIRAKEAVRLMLPVIHALHAAHRAGVVHRDLKPENIFLAQAGSHVQPKLLDFGIAKLKDQPCARVTSNGSLLGSPAYMAPEQARGADDVDQRADIFAVCVVLYELIAGRPAFDADNQYAVLRAVIEHELPPLEGPGCATLWPILQRGLVKDRRHRLASASALGTALARWLSAQGEQEDACGEPLAWNWDLEPPHEVSFLPTLALPRSKVAPRPHSMIRSRSQAGSWKTFAQAACACAAVPALVLWLTQSRPEVKPAASVPEAGDTRLAAVEPLASGLGSLSAAPLVAAEPEPAIAPELESAPAPQATKETTTPAPSHVRASRSASRDSSASRRSSSSPSKREIKESALGLKDPF